MVTFLNPTPNTLYLTYSANMEEIQQRQQTTTATTASGAASQKQQWPSEPVQSIVSCIGADDNKTVDGILIEALFTPTQTVCTD